MAPLSVIKDAARRAVREFFSPVAAVYSAIASAIRKWAQG